MGKHKFVSDFQLGIELIIFSKYVTSVLVANLSNI